MEQTFKMKASELAGQRMRIVVKDTPCRCVRDGCIPLTATTEGRLLRFEKMPFGPIGFLQTDDGTTICFDAGGDILSETIELELLTN